MKKSRISPPSLLALLCLGVSALPAFSQVVTSFENPANGTYANGTTVIGKTDTATGGAWTLFSGSSADIISSNANPLEGSLAVRINDASASSASGAFLAAPNANSLLTSPFTFEFSLAIDSVSAGTGSQVQVYFGNNVIGDSNHWLRFTYNDGNLQIVTGNGSTDTAVNVGAYTSYSALGDYVTFSLTIDPTTHKYTNAVVSGTLLTQDVTASILASNAGTIPWTASGGINPGNYVGVVIGSNDTAVVDFDVLRVVAVPEPQTALLFGLGIAFPLFRAMGRRRSN